MLYLLGNPWHSGLFCYSGSILHKQHQHHHLYLQYSPAESDPPYHTCNRCFQICCLCCQLLGSLSGCDPFDHSYSTHLKKIGMIKSHKVANPGKGKLRTQANVLNIVGLNMLAGYPWAHRSWNNNTQCTPHSLLSQRRDKWSNTMKSIQHFTGLKTIFGLQLVMLTSQTNFSLVVFCFWPFKTMENNNFEVMTNWAQENITPHIKIITVVTLMSLIVMHLRTYIFLLRLALQGFQSQCASYLQPTSYKKTHK